MTYCLAPVNPMSSEHLPPSEICDRVRLMQTRWQAYVAEGSFDCFIEFTVAVNCLVEHFNRLRLPGLIRVCEGLEKAALNCLGAPDAHPLGQQDVAALQRQVDSLLGAIASSQAVPQKRREEDRQLAPQDWLKPRAVWLIADPAMQHVIDAICRQLGFFGFRTVSAHWDAPLPAGDAPLAVIFIATDREAVSEHAAIAAVRARCAASQLVYLGAHTSIEVVVGLMRSGIDITIPLEENASTLLNCILDLVQSYELEKYRVLVVEDSRVAAMLVQRTLAEHGLDSRAIHDPGCLLEELQSYRPDLILMDMHMPRFTGIEATRVLRQMPAYKALPIVYLSGEADVGMQVEALRLGGDQFLIKPFNPVLLTAVIKTKIERFRETQRSTRIDGLTGLINHTAAKSMLKAMVESVVPQGGLTVAMIDIDHFKSINDTYGHPVGDQVIRSLAWLLKGRLRTADLIGRYGGEEFILALPDVSPEQAWQVIDRIRQDFSFLPHAHTEGSLYATFSAGIASWPDYDSAPGLTEAADQALLQAKRLGRNRVERA
jgi:diguanylate cyclase (GGDEF)-like protein